jgi:uncharacterized protein (TIGR02246 family)
MNSSDDAAVRGLLQQLWDAWNRRDAAAFAALFDEQGAVIGFDGSPMNGRAAIEASLSPIFRDHPTAAYVGKVRAVRLLGADVAVVSAVAGMLPPGKTAINPAVNAMQMLVAARQDGVWRIVSYQNTPAQFHGRPELAQALTNELQQLL